MNFTVGPTCYVTFGRFQPPTVGHGASMDAIATAANGKYYKSVDDNSLNEIFEDISDDIDREVEQISIKDYFFVAAAVVLAANIYIVYGKYKIVI